MGERPTKERIVREASLLFAQKGYEAVSVEEIAAAVGIKAPSLYKHYKGKQEIFDAVMREMQNHYDKSVAAMQMDGRDGAMDAALFENMTEEQLVRLGKDLFGFMLHDEYAGNFRKMLAAGQHRGSEMAGLYIKQYVDDPLSYQSALFGLLARAGTMRHWDAEIMALHFYGPIFLLLSVCDRQPEREADAQKKLERHIRQFNRLYRRGEDNDE